MVFTSIYINGSQQILEMVHNKSYEKAKYIFELFDDSVINKSFESILEFDQDFKFKFYIDNKVECVFDAFMMACLIKNMHLVKFLLESNENKLNCEYQFGTDNYTTPFTELVKNFRFNRRLLMSLVKTGDFTKKDNFGELLIPEDDI